MIQHAGRFEPALPRSPSVERYGHRRYSVRVARPPDHRLLRRPERRLSRAAPSRDTEAQPLGVAEAERAAGPARRHRRRGPGARTPGGRRPLLRADRTGHLPRDHHRQPVPADPDFQAPPCRLRRGGAPRGARCASRVRQRQGVSDVGTRHRDEARTREPRPDAAPRHPLPPERRPAQRRPLHVQGRLVAGHPGVGAQRGRQVRRADRDRAGAVEPLGLRGRRKADPAGRVLRRDHRVQPWRLRAVAPEPTTAR